MSQQAVLKLRRRGDLGERRRMPRHCHARAVRGGPSGAPPCHSQGVAGLRANGQGGAERLRMLRMTHVLRRCCPEAQGHRRWCAIARRNGAARRREAPELGRRERAVSARPVGHGGGRGASRPVSAPTGTRRAAGIGGARVRDNTWKIIGTLAAYYEALSNRDYRHLPLVMAVPTVQTQHGKL